MQADALAVVLKLSTIFNHMDTEETKSIGDALAFVESIVAKQSGLVAELHITPIQLQQMVFDFERQYDDSGNDSPGLGGADSSLSSGDSDH
ncbi:MAG UNVERIFIED_CONTAM: hypothetical protein LVQ98_09185 [Rickettsiaceae bacterium]